LGEKVAENILYSEETGMRQTSRSLVVDIGFGKFEWALEELFDSRGVLLLQEWQAGSIWQCVVRFIDHKAVCAAKSRSALFEDLGMAEWLPGKMFGHNNIAGCLVGTVFGPNNWFVLLHLIRAIGWHEKGKNGPEGQGKGPCSPGACYVIISHLITPGESLFVSFVRVGALVLLCWVVFLVVLNDSCVLSPLPALSEDWDGAWGLWCDWHPAFLQ